MKKSRVSIIKTVQKPTPIQIEQAVREAITAAGGFDEAVKPGCRVMIKPNLLAVPVQENSGATTNPFVCKAVADMVIERGATPVIAESSAIGVDTAEVMKKTGYDKLIEMGYEVVDLKTSPAVKLPVENGIILEDIEVYTPVTEVDAFISVPVLKTHDQLELTLGLKNMKGIITDKDKRRLHRVGVTKGVVDLCRICKPSYTVVDAIVCQEGLGPLHGIPLEMDLVLAGRDPVAVNTIAGRIAMFDPAGIPVIKLAAEYGLGTMDESEIEVAGEPLERVQRRFVRFSEDDRLNIPGLKLIYNEGTCTGCRNGVLSSVFDMKNTGELEKLSGVTIIAGAGPLPKGIDKNRVVAVGICCADEVKTTCEYVNGCPPNNVFIIEAIKKVAG